MSLPAREQRALDGIEITLQAGEARLTSMFAFFTCLCRDEAKPVTEDLGNASRRPRRHGARARSTVLFPIVIMIVITIGIVVPAIVVSLTGGHSRGCSPVTTARIPGPVVSQARTCQAFQPAR
jgi:hypothetical protein